MSTETDAGGGSQRLQKLLARAGYGSRRACENLIREGRVTVDGRVAGLGDRADPEAQLVAVDTVPVRFEETSVVYLLNKPRNVVTTASDPQGRRTVVDFLPPEPRAFPVGRLDRDTEGLLLLTNDGDFAHRIMHPRHELAKTYVATVDGVVSGRTLARLRKGVELEDGPVLPSSVRILGRRKASSLVEIQIAVGRNRVVRRTLEHVGHPVRRLVRTAIGPLRDTRLRPGEVRRLKPTEIARLEAEAGGSGRSSGR